jgi:hypothetical protein
MSISFDDNKFNFLGSNAGSFDFGVAGKTLTVSETCIIDQDLQKSATVQHGSLGLGSAPGAILHVEGAGTAIVTAGTETVSYFKQITAATHSFIAVDALAGYDSGIFLAEDGTYKWAIRNDYSSDTHQFEIRNASNAVRFQMEQDGSLFLPEVYADTVTSSRDLEIQSDGKIGYVSSNLASKTNISNIQNSDWLYYLNPVSFEYRKEVDGGYTDESEGIKNFGLIAEEVNTILQNNSVSEYLLYKDEEGNLEGVNYKGLIIPLLKLAQDQKIMINNLTSRIERLE